jgi:hypothetical protein
MAAPQSEVGQFREDGWEGGIVSFNHVISCVFWNETEE